MRFLPSSTQMPSADWACNVRTVSSTARLIITCTGLLSLQNFFLLLKVVVSDCRLWPVIYNFSYTFPVPHQFSFFYDSLYPLLIASFLCVYFYEFVMECKAFLSLFIVKFAFAFRLHKGERKRTFTKTSAGRSSRAMWGLLYLLFNFVGKILSTSESGVAALLLDDGCLLNVTEPSRWQ